MRADPFDPKDGLEEDPTWRGLRSLGEEPVPDDLLGRCLATIPTRPASRRRSTRRWLRAAGTAAAASLLLATGWLLLRPREISAATLLEAAGVTWSEVPACRRVVVHRRGGEVRTEEVWYVRGRGGRQETRLGDELIGVVVGDPRWEFRWDLRGGIVAAWSPGLLVRGAFDAAGKVLPCEAMLKWAEEHRGEVRSEADALDGRPVRKVVIRWPVVPGGESQTDVVWFDADSLRPVKQRSESSDGSTTEATLEYPAAEDVPADLFKFRPPPGVVLEVNDPALGRPVYSEARDEAPSAP